MKIFTWNMETGVTFGVEFENGSSAALYVAINDETHLPYYAGWDKKQALRNGEKFRKAKGDNWENGNLNYQILDLKVGKVRTIFKRVATSV
jgi:hypothetical protein